MFGQIEEMKKQLQEKLASIVVTGEAGDGMVKVEVDATKQIKNISINPEVMTPDDPEQLEDLLMVAINRAMAQAEEKAAVETQEMMSGLLPPGMDLPNLFG